MIPRSIRSLRYAPFPAAIVICILVSGPGKRKCGETYLDRKERRHRIVRIEFIVLKNAGKASGIPNHESRTMKELLKKIPFLRSLVQSLRNRIMPLIPDGMKDRYRAREILWNRCGQKLDLKLPKTFSQKIQWLKLYYRNPLFTQLADKYSVRRYVAEKIGEEYLVPLFGVYEAVSEIDFDALPEKFALKGTHGSTWNILCHDKKQLNWEEAKEKMDRWLHTNFYDYSREWVYKNIKPRIVCEKLLEMPSGEAMWDYKIFCFNGLPKYIVVDVGRFSEHTRNVYDLEWDLQPVFYTYPPSSSPLPKPEQLPKMLELASILSQESPFARIDFYIHEARIYFGEITFYPASGFMPWRPREFDETVGQLLKLPDKPWGAS